MNKATLAFVFASSCAFCDSAQLEAVNIIGSSEQSIASNGEFLGSTRYDKDAIDASLSKDGTISDIIKKNPNARVSRGERTSKNGGEIASQNISINGAEVYQNNFTLDGININNYINPLGGILSTGSVANITPFLSNPSLGLSVNTDLLENIEVIDSFVSAKYGGFQGGVINAKTRDPKREFGGKIYFGYTSDKLTKVHIDDMEQESYDYATSSSYQPEFKKYKSGVTLEGYVSENFGLMFDYNRLYSTILQRKYNSDYDIDVNKKDEKRNMHRMNENYFLKGVYTNDRLKLTPMSVRSKIGLLYEGYVTYDYLMIKDLLELYSCQYKSRFKREIFFELFNKLGVSIKQKISTLSLGQKSQVVLGLILASSPKLLILDDYSLGLDTGYRRLFCEFLHDFVRSGQRSVLMTTHNVNDLENLLDKVVILRKDKEPFVGSFDKFRQGLRGFSLDKSRDLSNIKGIESKTELNGELQIYGFLDEAFSDAKELSLSFEDAFLGYVGRY